MKRILCLLMSFVLLFGTFASAAGLDFLTDGTLLNYSGTDTVTMEMDIPAELLDEISALLGSSKLENFVELEALLKGLASTKQTAQISARISEDFKRIELSMEAETQKDVQVNKNLNVAVCAKSGVWMDVDFRNAAQPKFLMIYSAPTLNKYITMDVLAFVEAMEGTEEKDALVAMLTALYSRETLQPLMEKNRALMEEYATVKTDSRTCSVHFDSAGFSAYLAAMINEVIDLYVPMGLILPAEADVIKQTVLLYAPKISLLGEDGYTVVYSLTGKKTVQKMTADMDFEVCLKSIAALLDETGASWPFENDGSISLRVQEEMKMKLSGDSVTVKYPVLTEENSISYQDLYAVDMEPEEPADVDQPQYPYDYIYVTASQLPYINGKYYVPLRAVLESAYDDAFSIEFTADESLWITSPYFDGIQTKVGTNTAYVNGAAIPVDDVILVDGSTTYVSQSFFENIFGWRLSCVGFYLQANECYCEFESFPYEAYEEF